MPFSRLALIEQLATGGLLVVLVAVLCVTAAGGDITTVEGASSLPAIEQSEAEPQMTLCHLRGDLRNRARQPT